MVEFFFYTLGIGLGILAFIGGVLIFIVIDLALIWIPITIIGIREEGFKNYFNL